MPKQHATHQKIHVVTNPDAALRMLEEAWSYFTPGGQQTLPAVQYEELPGAA